MGFCATFADSKQHRKLHNNTCLWQNWLAQWKWEIRRYHHISVILVQKYNVENDLVNVYLIQCWLNSKGNAIDPVKVQVIIYQVIISNVDLLNYKIALQLYVIKKILTLI